MISHHHPSSQILLQYSAGQLDGVHRLMVEMHQQMCPTCQHVVAELESIGGVILENDIKPTAMTDCAFSQLMSQIDLQVADEPLPTEASDTDSNDSQQLSLKLRELFKTQQSDNLNWQWRTKKFAEIKLSANDDFYEAKLIYIKKGMKVPRHTHKGQEITLVMKGAFRDELGVYEKGDYITRDGHHEHQPIAESDCICLAITTDDLKFTGTFGPVLNWFMK
jgi:putative transcriptional regulator